MIDLNKKYRTKSGDEVILEGIDNDPHYPVNGKIIELDGISVFGYWTLEGRYFLDYLSNMDLVEINETNEKL